MNHRSWVVLFELFNCIDREKTHVFSNDEPEVVQSVLLGKYDVVSELLRQPRDIFGICKLICIARHHYGGYFEVC